MTYSSMVESRHNPGSRWNCVRNPFEESLSFRMTTTLELNPIPDADVDNVYLARQPIYDRSLNVVAYEVLFRQRHEGLAVFQDGNQATSQVLLGTLIDFGLKRLVGERLAYVNLTREFLTGQNPLPAESSRIVLEVLENLVIDEEIRRGVERLAEQGFTLALDDATYRPELEPILPFIEIVKLDVLSTPESALESEMRAFRRRPVKMLAEKVETHEQFERCKSLGFDLFQGYFLSRPQIVQGKAPKANKTAVLRLIGELNNPQATSDDIERIVRTDPAMTYKLLRYVNSARIGLRRKVESLKQAIQLIGLQGIRSLATLVSLAGFAELPGEMFQTALLRAHFCEKLGALQQTKDTGAYFITGLVSALDVILEMPLENILESISLTQELHDAILSKVGPVGEALRSAIAHERGDWSHVRCAAIPARDVRSAYALAIVESHQTWMELICTQA
jgi:c-di-GMP phosphodiesterase